MSPFPSAICGLAALAFLANAQCARGDVSVTAEGTVKIYVTPAELKAPSESPAEDPAGKNRLALAVDDLSYHLEKMSGMSVRIVEENDPEKVPANAIVVGDLAAKLGCTVEPTRWMEGFRLQTKDGRVLIQGETANGKSHGIYTLLRDLGCDWLMPGPLGEIIPEKKEIVVADCDKSETPDFGERWMWYRGGAMETGELIANEKEREEFAVWKRRQRMGIAPAFEHTGQGHFWDHIVHQYAGVFKQDPSMLALVRNPDGTLTRQGPQIESTNVKVVELLAQDIRDRFVGEGWPKDKQVTLPIGPADGDGFSISPESQAVSSGEIDPLMGGADATDLVVKLANDVLDRVGAEYPNLSLGFYCYSLHADYPKKVTPRPGVFPLFAPISYSRLHSTVDPHSKTRAYYRNVIQKWAELAKSQGNRLLVSEYNWNLADNMLPFTRLQMIGEDMPFYQQAGIQGFNIEATKAWAVNGAHDYLCARMMWNSRLDWKLVLREYCQKAFGPAARAMESYYLRLAKTQSEAGQEAGSYFSAPLVFDARYVQEAERDVKSAQAEKLTEAQRERVDGAVFPFKTLKQYLRWNKAMGAFDFVAAKSAYDEILSDWKAQLERRSLWVAREVPGYMQGLMAASTTQALKYSSKPWHLVFRLPEKLATALDPTGQGERLNLQGEKINDGDWMLTHTYGSTWDAQGLGLYREGSVWYRAKFRLQERSGDEAAGLFLGGFEDEARVWINGKYMGSSGIKFATPAVFDLSGGARFGAENTLAIQILRNSQLNEIGLGGLLRPSFVFVGPPFSQTPSETGRVRVLPGGEKIKEEK